MTPPRPTRPRDRRGYTLVELLLVITVVGVLSATGAVLIGLLMSAESRGTGEIVVQTTFARLGRQLRADVHGAASADVADVGDMEGGQLNLTGVDGRNVRYIAATGLVTREVDSGADQHSREEYLLPDGNSRFVIDNEPGIVRLEHQRPGAAEAETGVEGLQDVPLRKMEIEAALNLDRHHQGLASDRGDENGR